MKFKATLWLSLGLGGLALFYFFVDLPQETKLKQEQERSEKILLFDPENVEEFSIIKDSGTITVKRQGGEHWMLVTPVNAPADNDSTSAYLNQLQAMRFSRVVEEQAPDPAVFGLSKPSLSLSLKLKDQKELGLRVGDDNPMGQSRYIQRANEQKILLTQTPRNSFETSAYNLRDKTVLTFDTATISLVEITQNKTTIKLQKLAGIWNIIEDGNARADQDEVENFLHTLLSAQVKHFVEEKPPSLVPYGLESPSISLTLKGEENREPQILLIGNKTDNEGYYAKISSASNVIILSNELIQKVSRGMAAYRDKKLSDFKEEDVTDLRLKTLDNTVHLHRDTTDKNKWSIEEPLKTPASTAAVNSLLFDLKSARIKEFIDVTMNDPKLFGLLPPERELEVLDKDGNTWSLKLGNNSSDKKLFFAQRSGEPAIFALEDTIVDKIFRPLHDLKDRKILSINTDAVHRIVLHYPDQKIELRREGEQWDLLQPEVVRKIKPFHATGILWTLNALEYNTLPDPSAGDRATGFNTPAVVISLWDKNDQKIESLTIGNKSEDQTDLYARIEGKQDIYLIPLRTLSELPSKASKFKE